MQILQTTVVLSLEHNVMEHKEHCFSLTNANTCASSKDGNSTASVALTSFTQQRMRAKHLSMMTRGNGPSMPSECTFPPALYTNGRDSVSSIALV